MNARCKGKYNNQHAARYRIDYRGCNEWERHQHADSHGEYIGSSHADTDAHEIRVCCPCGDIDEGDSHEGHCNRPELRGGRQDVYMKDGRDNHEDERDSDSEHINNG